MTREVRRVPKDWQHPKDKRGHYIPLHGGSGSQHQRQWEEANAKWKQGLRQDSGSNWVLVEDEYKHLSFAEWDGPKPEAQEYMPDWSEAERTHFQMYETTTEGTPISPVMSSPEGLARWLTDTNATVFGDMTTCYDNWLNLCLKCSTIPPWLMPMASS